MKSKQQEIDQFLAFQKRVEKSGYLAGILAGMENYVQNQIQNDTAIPVMTWVNMNEKRVVDAETARTEMAKVLAYRGREIDMAKITIEALNGAIGIHRETNGRLKAERDDAWEKLVDQAHKLNDALVEMRKYRQELIELKAEKYDELMAEKKQ